MQTSISPTEVSARHDSAVGETVLLLQEVDKKYPGVHALKSVTLEVRAGEIHAIVGENGAGKSTLVGVAAGSVSPESGTVEIAGASTTDPTPQWSRDQGLAIVYQEPALLPDLTVAENMAQSMPEKLRPRIGEQVEWAREILSSWGDVAQIDPQRPVRTLQPDARFVVEIARAIAESPKVIVLDEPTEHLLPEAVEVLFRKIDELIAANTAVVYISHKIRDVKRISHRISVLRDGRSEGTYPASDLSEDDIVDLVVGRENELHREGFIKPVVAEDAPVQLSVKGLQGDAFSHIDFEVRRGEIVGFAGIEGQGQRDVMRALAGLSRSRGAVTVNGKPAAISNAASAQASGIGYIPQDRHREGVFPGLSLRENAAMSSVADFARAGFVADGALRRRIYEWFHSLRVKAPSSDVHIETLSGGNQQKVVLSRILLKDSEIILADEPTQGVDVGARSEIYEILRRAAEKGAAVIVLSASAVELEEICNRVYVFSRGQIASELAGDEVTDRRITEAALKASKFRDTQSIRVPRSDKMTFGERVVTGDLFPSAILVFAILTLGVVASIMNPFYLTTRNFGLMLPLIATLAFFAIAQQFVMMVGGIDISVGPLASLLVVVGSFVLTVDHTAFGLVVGMLIVIGVAIAVGIVNWFLVVMLNITPLIATLITFTALQGVSFLLRPLPGGKISRDLNELVTSKLGFIPIAFIVALILAIALEFYLRRTRSGIRLRAVGSNSAVATRVGVKSKRVMFFAYVATSVCIVPAALLLMAQAGTGNSTIGDSYVLTSIGAAVLGGASLFGGRGSFIGVFLGAALLIQANTVVQFLGLSTYWQQWFIGGLTLIAAAVYSKIRISTNRA